MSLFHVFDIAGSALSAQSQRLNVVASNLANADSAVSANGTPYRAKQVVFSAAPLTRQMQGMGVQVARVTSSMAQSLPPPPGALFLSVSTKDVCDGPVLKVKPRCIHLLAVSEPADQGHTSLVTRHSSNHNRLNP